MPLPGGSLSFYIRVKLFLYFFLCYITANSGLILIYVIQLINILI